MIQPKELFVERMKKLLPESDDYEKFMFYSRKKPLNFIRCNTIKISVQELKSRLREKGWRINQPFFEEPEIMLIKSGLMPGELGKAIEHVLGYYYVQGLSSMLPVIALSPKPGDILLDLCASPGSKTTQAAAMMQNKGTIIANDYRLDRVKILVSNLERTGCMNVIVTRNDGVQLCKRLENKMRFDKILVDVPCSGEGTLRSSEKTFLIWNIRMINKLSRQQMKLASSVVKLLKNGGEMLYSTCTYAPEENEKVVSFLIENFPLEIKKLRLPVKVRKGIRNWEGKEFADGIEKCCRIYPQDNDTEGFFLAKLRKVE